MSHAQYTVGPYYIATPFRRVVMVSLNMVAAILVGVQLCGPPNCDPSRPIINQPCDQMFVWPLTEAQLKISYGVFLSVCVLHVKEKD